MAATNPIRQRCSACGASNALHRHPDEICVECSLEDLYDLLRYKGQIWSGVPLDSPEADELIGWMREDRAELWALRGTEP